MKPVKPVNLLRFYSFTISIVDLSNYRGGKEQPEIINNITVNRSLEPTPGNLFIYDDAFPGENKFLWRSGEVVLRRGVGKVGNDIHAPTINRKENCFCKLDYTSQQY
jgi:hypothetical protein